MAIDNGSLTDADEVMDAMGELFNIQTININQNFLNGWDESYLGGDPTFDNQVFNNDLTGFGLSDTVAGDPWYPLNFTGTMPDIGIFGANYDLWNSSVDSAKWEDVGASSGTLSENTTEVQDLGPSTVANVTLSAKAIDLNTSGTSGETYISFTVEGNTNSGANVTSYELIIRDVSGNQVILETDSAVGTNSILTVQALIQRTSATNFKLYSGSQNGSNKDVSSLEAGEAWHLRVRGQTTAGSTGLGVTIKIKSIQEANENTISAGTLESGALATGTTYTDALVSFANSSGATATPLYELSANGGSNWETITLNKIHRFSTTGTDLRLRVTGSSASSETELFRAGQLGIWFNTGAV